MNTAIRLAALGAAFTLAGVAQAQVQLPPTQSGDVMPLHGLPQKPQLRESVSRSAQPWSVPIRQHVSFAAQAPMPGSLSQSQAPERQRFATMLGPVLHAMLQPPQ